MGGAEKARLRPADEEGTEHETPPRERYAALILEIIEFDDLFFAAVSQLAMGDLLAARPHLAGLLKLASTDHGVREVARELVRSWSTMSADAWAVGGTGAPLQFAHARYKSALPEFLTKLSRALPVAARRDAARHDLRLAAVAALVSIAPPDSEDTSGDGAQEQKPFPGASQRRSLPRNAHPAPLSPSTSTSLSRPLQLTLAASDPLSSLPVTSPGTGTSAGIGNVGGGGDDGGGGEDDDDG